VGHPATLLAYAVLLWWVGTGLILVLNHLQPRTFRASLAGATLVLLASLGGTLVTARLPTLPAAYAGFACALGCWGWQEMTFFMGAITGPRRGEAVAGSGWRRFWEALGTCLYHELAMAAVGLVMVGLSWGQPNQVACDTYLALWAMRVSAHLNVYFGVRNLNEGFVPRRLAYLRSYMRRRSMNGLMPVSVMAGAAATAWFVLRARAAGGGFALAGPGFVAAILGLGVAEHLFLVLPLPFAALWSGFSRRCPVVGEAGTQPSRHDVRVLTVGAAAKPVLIGGLPRAMERS
jgi:putative photosynthetic complex assembly protein 2